jgi:hypothetical protein
MSDAYDVVAASVVAEMPTGPRLAVLGSTSFWAADSESLCRTIAGRLAQRKDLILITGGMTGVGEAFAQAAVECRDALGLAEHVYQVLPLGHSSMQAGYHVARGRRFSRAPRTARESRQHLSRHSRRAGDGT